MTTEAGRPLELGCNVTTAAGSTIHQVRWLNHHGRALLSYEQSVPLRISYQDASVQLTAHPNNGSYVTIKRVRPEDEGCYSCVFDIFPTGSQEGRTCIRVIGESNVT